MHRTIFCKRSIGIALTTLAAAGAVAAYATATATADGRTIDGAFCLPPTTAGPPPGHWFCMQASFGDQTAQGYCNQDVPLSLAPLVCNTRLASEDPTGTIVAGRLSLRPGTYWLAVDDNSNAHNFELRSCPGSTTACAPGAGAEQELTPISNADLSSLGDSCTGTPGATNDIRCTVKVELKPGWYRLFCDATSPVVHEPRGMYVDFEVGGEGRVG